MYFVKSVFFTSSDKKGFTFASITARANENLAADCLRYRELARMSRQTTWKSWKITRPRNLSGQKGASRYR